MNPVTGAVPPLIRGHGIRFEVDRWTWRRLDAARFDGERRHLLATRGRPWHADPRHGGDTDALETWHLLAGRHQGGGMGLTVTGPGGKLDVSWEPDGAIPPDGRFYPNPTRRPHTRCSNSNAPASSARSNPPSPPTDPTGGRPASWKSPNHTITPCCARCG